MKIAQVDGRACIVTEHGGVDVAAASDDRFGSTVDCLVGDLDALQHWFTAEAPQLDRSLSAEELLADLDRLGPPIASPPQIFAIGLNYEHHAAEANLDLPDQPMVFTKWQSSLAGPSSTIPLSSDTVDWEVELVAVIGAAGRNISVDAAMGHVAGLCIGQDVSDRRLQMASAPAQFSMAKSLENFSPIGPWLTTCDELRNPHDLAIACHRDGHALQESRTSSMIFDVPTLVAYLSSKVELRVGDLIFTGTPEGVGVGRRPRVFIEPGWQIESSIEGLGRMRNQFV